MANASRSKPIDRSPPLQVLALGMPRTGTNSICEALNILKIPCYHGFTLIANVRDSDAWCTAMDWKLFGLGQKPQRPFWDHLLGGYGAVADLPGIIFVEELLETYPDAKVVLVERDIEKWYTSWNTGVISAVWNPVTRLVASLDPYFIGRLDSVSSRWVKGWFMAKSKPELQERSRPKYREHYAHVRRVTPEHRLLEFDLKDGWSPLCSFLGKDVPDIPFPRGNDSKELQTKIRGYIITGMRNAAGRALPLLIAAGVAAFAWKYSNWS